MFHDILIKHTHHLPRFVPWTIEVSTLKHELWQTIQAHNHNADLLKHHKDAIDQAWLCLVGDECVFDGKSRHHDWNIEKGHLRCFLLEPLKQIQVSIKWYIT